MNEVFVCTCPRCGGNVTQVVMPFAGGRPPPPTCQRCGQVLEQRGGRQDDYQRLLDRMGGGR